VIDVDIRNTLGKHFLEGMQAKEIAIEMRYSPRHIERWIEVGVAEIKDNFNSKPKK